MCIWICNRVPKPIDSVNKALDLFPKSAPDWMRKELAEEVDNFISTYGDRLEQEFRQRYGFDFAPELWETTACDFLITVRRMATGRPDTSKWD
jgi:hypothetical protein